MISPHPLRRRRRGGGGGGGGGEEEEEGERGEGRRGRADKGIIMTPIRVWIMVDIITPTSFHIRATNHVGRQQYTNLCSNIIL